jgi:drug/metabolite transporter (DMT)-like permease
MLPMAALFLKERITVYHGLLALLAVVGVALVVKPSADIDVTPALLALASAFFAAIAYVLIRKLSFTEHPLTIVFWFNLISTIAAVPVAAPSLVLPSWTTAAVLLGMALLGTLGQVLMTHAYRHSEAGRLAVVGSTGAIFGALFDYLVWDHLPDALTALGGILVIISCAMIQVVGKKRVSVRASSA